MDDLNDGLSCLLDDLVGRVHGVGHAVVLSSDGLLAGSSAELSGTYAEHLAALASTLQSIARETGRRFDGGGVRQTLIEMDHGFMFVTAARSGACLAVLADSEVDVGLIAYEMNVLIGQVAQYVHTAPRRLKPSAQL